MQNYRLDVSNRDASEKIISKIFVSPCTNSPRNSLRTDDSPPSLSPAYHYSEGKHL